MVMGHMGLYTFGIRRTNQPIRAPRFRPSGHPIQSPFPSSTAVTSPPRREKESGGEVHGDDGGLPGAAGGAEGAGAPALPPRAQGHPQLGRPPPPLLPGRELSPLFPTLSISSSLADLISSSSLAQASDLRDKFEANRSVEDPDVIDRLIVDAEAQYSNFQHPDPYIGKFCSENYPSIVYDVIVSV
ncbi:hypothetical protein PR202_ga14380 [Eleusine coracana subsp. coracana]|uniref:NADH dehydrogenase [ubiquinone] 1 beta subcomplex subunit 9 n=1 Tax=Eleusine coracana subsp. coracana TaxID=191504 RepID=A0AAV5CHA3_ELECO|nr:hypothetical protein PR202_ga14380 [Eleusine coracana subsp. coracana]